MGHGNLAPMVDFEHKSGYQSHSFPIITKKGKGSLLGRVGKWGGGKSKGPEGRGGEGVSPLGSAAFPFGCVWMYEVERRGLFLNIKQNSGLC